MKFLRNFLDKLKPNFSEGGKFEKFSPVFNAFDTFLFTPNQVTSSGSHIRDGADLKRIMSTVIIALIPTLLFGAYNLGLQYSLQIGGEYTFFDCFILGMEKILPMLIVSYGVGLTIEFIFCVFRGHEVSEGYLVTGILIPLVMPVNLPLWMLALSVAFCVIIGKEVFGGTGMNIFNPALMARAFLFFSYPTYMSGNAPWVIDADKVDAISGETILGSLSQNMDIKYSVLDMFYGYVPGSIGETSFLAIMIGAFILIFSGVGSWKIILSGFLGGALMAIIFNVLGIEGNYLTNFPWYQHILVGGFAFGVVFMATDPTSAAQTEKGKYIYGGLIGILAIMIRVFNPAYPEGIMLAILFMNIFASTIDHYVVKSNVRKRLKRLKRV